MIDSKTVLPCYNTTNPGVALSQTKDFGSYKLYLADTGLFVTMMFNSEDGANVDLYQRLLGDSLSADLGYLYENAVAQIIASCGRDLYFHSWRPKGKTHAYEVDFLLADKVKEKIVAIEVKSSGVNSHKSIDKFAVKYSNVISRCILFSQKDVSRRGALEMEPLYLAPMIIGGIGRG